LISSTHQPRTLCGRLQYAVCALRSLKNGTESAHGHVPWRLKNARANKRDRDHRKYRMRRFPALAHSIASLLLANLDEDARSIQTLPRCCSLNSPAIYVSSISGWTPFQTPGQGRSATPKAFYETFFDKAFTALLAQSGRGYRCRGGIVPPASRPRTRRWGLTKKLALMIGCGVPFCAKPT